ncbi:MAG: M48 family metalloprotease [Acidobacteriota bacterium]
MKALRFLLILGISFYSCAVNPVTGKKELMLISEQGEIELGQSTDQQIKDQFGIYDDAKLNSYVAGIGENLVPHTHRPHLEYHFAVLDTPVVNAFAVPGGYIYVTRGILALFSSEAELAVVLGHELGHVNARHSVQKLSQAMLVQIGFTVGGALSETFQKISGLAGIGIQLLFLKYSRDDEREADWLGIEYARKGSYNPEKMVDFFQSLQKMGDLSEGQSLPGFLSTHPLTSERIKNAQNMILPEDNNLKVLQNTYLARLDGMVFGNDPRQGYVEENAFYHPLMLFTFSFPSKWKLQNQPSQVILSSEDGKAAVVLQAEESSESLHNYARNITSKLENTSLLQENHLTINGLQSYQQLLELRQEEAENLRLRISFIRKSPHIFTLTALSSQSDFSSYDFRFGTIIGSFMELTDKKYINRSPEKLRLIKAKGRDSLKSIFQSKKVDEKHWPQLAAMNGLELNQVPKKDQLIKIVN